MIPYLPGTICLFKILQSRVVFSLLIYRSSCWSYCLQMQMRFWGIMFAVFKASEVVNLRLEIGLG
jgi:hypothetical protein